MIFEAKLAETAVQNKGRFQLYKSGKQKDALLKESHKCRANTEDHDTSTQKDKRLMKVSKLTQAFKAGCCENFEQNFTIGSLATEAQDLLAQKPNHPSGDALVNLLNKNKDLLASSE